ncbi:MAG: hypothetical protein COC01_08580 [Bacteroidetes bacterium]|nr:MAG: hypothetical protein COC01_08580 [Bacteroidota bacterium]
MSKEVVCPKCGSSSLQANKRGYSLLKGVVGLAVPGGVLWGLHGYNKINITCLGCGHKFKAGKGKVVLSSPPPTQTPARTKTRLDQPEPPPKQKSTLEKAEELEKLNQLRQDGAISDQEFDKLKKEVLDGQGTKDQSTTRVFTSEGQVHEEVFKTGFCPGCGTKLTFMSTPNFGGGKLNDGGRVCRECFSQMCSIDTGFGFNSKKRYSSSDVKNHIQ